MRRRWISAVSSPPRRQTEHARPGARSNVLTIRIRRWALALCLGLASLSGLAQDLAAVPPLDSPVVDTTGTLSAEDTSALAQQALDLQQRKGSQLQILIIPTVQPEDISSYANRAFKQWRVGREKVNDGVLVLVAKDDRQMRIEVGYGLEGAIPDATSARIIQEYMVPKFRQGDFGGGLKDATAAIVKLIDGEALPAPMARSQQPRDRSGEVFNAIMLAVFVAFFARVFLAWLPKIIRVPAVGAVAGLAAFVSVPLVVAAVIGGIAGAFIALVSGTGSRFANRGGWGGGDWGGGGFGGGGGSWGGGSSGGGGGWSGGGGMSGGGGASGSW